MAEQTQTEKLKSKIRNTSMANPIMKPFHLTWEQIDLILIACKEAKLVFTDYSFDNDGNIILQGLKEIEIE